MSELRNIEMEGMILGDHCPGQDTLQLRIFVFVQLLGCGHIFCIFTKAGVFMESTHNPDTARGGENGGQLEPAELMLCLVSARSLLGSKPVHCCGASARSNQEHCTLDIDFSVLRC